MYHQQAGNTLALTPKVFCQKIDKKPPLVKWTAEYVFFIGVAIKITVLVAAAKITVLVSRRTTPMSLC